MENSRKITNLQRYQFVRFMKKFSIPLLCLIVSAVVLSLTSCQKDNVKGLSGTRWKTSSVADYYVLEFTSKKDVRVFVADSKYNVKDGLREGTYSFFDGRVYFDGSDFYLQEVTDNGIYEERTYYFRGAQLIKGVLRVEAKEVLVTYPDPLDKTSYTKTIQESVQLVFEKL